MPTDTNILKGGDFMEIEQRPGEQFDPTAVALAEQQVHVELEAIPAFTRNQRVGEGNNSRHPERTLIERSQTVSGIAGVQNPTG